MAADEAVSTAERYTLANAHGIAVEFIPLGGTITSIRVPDRHGRVAGFDTAEEYARDTRYMGALIGRFANRIAGGQFAIDGVEHSLPCNNGPNQLHGGPSGFSGKTWMVAPFERRRRS